MGALNPEALEKAREAAEATWRRRSTSFMDTVDAAILAYLAACEAQGVVQVPREPTEEMLRASLDETHKRIDWTDAKAIWRAMLAASRTRTAP